MPRKTTRILAAVMTAAVLVSSSSGCAPSPDPIDSPIGTWSAESPDHGTLTVSSDGTFAFSGSTFNPIQTRDADGNFNASGAWRLVDDGQRIKMTFAQASQGDFDVPVRSFSAAFTTGTISFAEPDETVGIRFALETAGAQ